MPSWPYDVICHHIIWSTLVQVMACCLMATPHYLNQCCLIISEVMWLSTECNFTRNAQDIYPWYVFKITELKLQLHLQGASEKSCCCLLSPGDLKFSEAIIAYPLNHFVQCKLACKGSVCLQSERGRSCFIISLHHCHYVCLVHFPEIGNYLLRDPWGLVYMMLG